MQSPPPDTERSGGEVAECVPVQAVAMFRSMIHVCAGVGVGPPAANAPHVQRCDARVRLLPDGVTRGIMQTHDLRGEWG